VKGRLAIVLVVLAALVVLGAYLSHRLGLQAAIPVIVLTFLFGCTVPGILKAGQS
jgi:hypothetical protein